MSLPRFHLSALFAGQALVLLAIRSFSNGSPVELGGVSAFAVARTPGHAIVLLALACASFVSPIARVFAGLALFTLLPSPAALPLLASLVLLDRGRFVVVRRAPSDRGTAAYPG